MAFNRDLDERIQSYNNKETEADPAYAQRTLPLQDAHKLNPIFSKFIEDGQRFFVANPEREDLAKQYEAAIADYLLMKERTRQEMSIMEANRVGVDKNLANIVRNTAKAVGLSMPKEYKD
jgi:hypothetical protein